MNFRILVHRDDCNTDPFYIEFEGFNNINRIQDADDFAIKYIESLNSFVADEDRLGIILVEMEEYNGGFQTNACWDTRSYVRSALSVTCQHQAGRHTLLEPRCEDGVAELEADPQFIYSSEI